VTSLPSLDDPTNETSAVGTTLIHSPAIEQSETRYECDADRDRLRDPEHGIHDLMLESGSGGVKKTSERISLSPQKFCTSCGVK